MFPVGDLVVSLREVSGIQIRRVRATTHSTCAVSVVSLGNSDSIQVIGGSLDLEADALVAGSALIDLLDNVHVILNGLLGGIGVLVLSLVNLFASLAIGV